MLTYIHIYKESLPFSLNMQSLVILILFFFYVWATCLHWVAVGGGSPPIRSSTTKTRLACVLYLAIDLGTTQVLFPLFLSTVMKHSKPSFSVYPPMVLKHSKPSCSLCVCVNESVDQSCFICLYPWYWNVLVQSLCLINLIIPRKERTYTSLYFIYWF